MESLAAAIPREKVSCPCCDQTNLRLLYTRADKFEIDPEPFGIVRCDACAVSFVSPRPAEDRLIDFYPDTYAFQEEPSSESFAARFLKKMETYYRTQGLNHDVSRFLKAAGLSGGRLLEIGCGTGDRLVRLREKGFQVMGLEPAPAACQFGKEHYGLPIIESRVEDWSGPDELLDSILIFNVLEHLPHPVKELKRITGWLKPGGVLALQIPNGECWQAQKFGPRWAAMDVPRDLYYFSPAALKKAFQQAGLQIFQIEHGHHWMHPPTLVPSLFPSLDPAMIWSEEEGSQASAAVKKILWAAATLAAIPWALVEKKMGSSPLMTLYAKKEK